MFNYTLRRSDKGQEVTRLQSEVGATADGDYGPKTEKAVKEHQEDNGLLIDGIAGPQTLDSLGIKVLPGIDLSSHNGTVDFKKVAAAGVEYAWIKVTEGTTHQNPGFQKKFDDARKEGIMVGAYHFGRSDTSPNDPKDWEREATNFLLQLEKAGLECGDLIPVLDVENGMKTDDNHNCEWCLKWLEKVGNETNTRPAIYSARWAWQLYIMKADRGLQDQLATYPLWLASYNEGIEPKRKTKLWNQWDVWQYTGSGAVSGVKGRCDINWMAGGQLDRLKVPNS
jgi:GH25 family lysozyme M1 (1,4-beta-N-acetylmuramidase)